MSNSRHENIGDRLRTGGLNSVGSMPGLVAWLDGSESGLMTVAGGLVSDVRNKVTGVSFATAAGAERPTLTASAQNGRSGLTFDGAATLLHCDALAAKFTGSDKPFSVFSAIKRSSVAATGTILCFANSGVATQRLDFTGNNTPKYQSNKVDDAATTVFSEVGTSDTAAHQLGFTSPGTTISIWADGANIASGVAFDVGDTTLNSGAIGARVSTTTVSFFAGLIFELLIFSREVTTLERQTIEAYLKQKWGL